MLLAQYAEFPCKVPVEHKLSTVISNQRNRHVVHGHSDIRHLSFHEVRDTITIGNPLVDGEDCLQQVPSFLVGSCEISRNIHTVFFK
jgi:hypothetical protein